jgi:hypothetical protein
MQYRFYVLSMVVSQSFNNNFGFLEKKHFSLGVISVTEQEEKKKLASVGNIHDYSLFHYQSQQNDHTRPY